MTSSTNSLPPLFRLDIIFDACQKDSLILTANQRLATKAIQAWGLYQQAKNISSWQAPRIYSLDQWFNECWLTLQKKAYKKSLSKIISSDQERVIWEQITSNKALMQTEVLAKQAASAYKTLQRWELSTEQLNEYDHDISASLLKEWCDSFENSLLKNKCITLEQSFLIIGDAYTNQILEVEQEINLVGFDDIAPLLSAQLNKMTSQTITLDDNIFTPKSLSRMTFSDSKTEMTAVAQWTKDILSAAKASQEKVRVGIIVPNLGQSRGQIERALTDSFEGHSLLTQTPRYTLPYNISAGIPLGKTPLFIDTFLLLKLNQKQWKMDDLYRLLSSKFWGDYSRETELRARAISYFQKLGIFTISTQELCRYIKSIKLKRNNKTPQDNINEVKTDKVDIKETQALDCLDYFEKNENIYNNKRLPSEWVNVFLYQLNILHWPGERKPDSLEYQQTQLWYQLLEAFTRLDTTLGNIGVDTAIAQLKDMANHQPFQAKVPDSPIQVLGILEGAGLHFTHCWILGLHQQTWPPAPQPNPLLPISLQRQHNMPHASSVRELQFAQSLTNNYRQCATNIIFSSPSYDSENEIELSPSQLIINIPLQPLPIRATSTCLDDNENDFEKHIALQYITKKTELVKCDQGPKVNLFDINKDGILTGGSGIIKSQAANPFNAFVKNRLRVTIVNEPVMGFSAIEKGNILHQALAFIWQQLQTQKQLLVIDINELTLLVKNTVNVEANNVIKYKRHHFGKELYQLEIERQTELILAWLAYEKTRRPFTVKSIEESCIATIKGYSLHLRLDRVDEIIDHTNDNINDKAGEAYHLIIDYKSGLCSLKDWSGEKPNDPQLPFYLSINNLALTQANNTSSFKYLNAIAFGQVNVKRQTLLGLHHELNPMREITSIEKNKNNLKTNWEEASTEWSRISFELFDEFLLGNTSIHYSSANQLSFGQDFICVNRFYDGAIS